MVDEWAKSFLVRRRLKKFIGLEFKGKVDGVYLPLATDAY